MDINERLVHELRRLRYAAWVVAVAVFAATASMVYSVLQTMSWPEAYYAPGADPAKSSACAVEGFYRDASALQEGGKFKELIAFSEARLKACPADHHAWWFKAKALAVEERWDDALEALKRTELLRPDWRRAYVVPLRESIEWNKSQHRRAPDK